ncbi:MAG: adenylate/guanylate cyclase domain-containing protein [Pseudomonadota bacterium]
MSQPLRLEERIQGSRSGNFLQELFGNSIHFPLVNIVLELLLKGSRDYLLEPDPYILLTAALLQAWIVSGWEHAGRPRPLIGNLIGPGFYTLTELWFSGTGFFSAPHHLAYWGFALSIGFIQAGRHQLSGGLRDLLVLLENVVRTSFVLVMYIILETLLGECQGVGPFFAYASHQFLAVVMPFLGLILGLSQLNSKRFMERLRTTAQQLRQYSEWMFGYELLNLAVADPQHLSLKRRERAIMFLDIRGFTAWSEGRTPESVVDLINRFYAAAEPHWKEAICIKLIADEIMLVFPGVDAAIKSVRSMCASISQELLPHGLNAGVGLHFGSVVEGLIGTSSHQSYDLLGESVNKAKRLCDHAAGAEVLISEQALSQLQPVPQIYNPRELAGKNGSAPITAYSLNPLGS